MIIWGFKSYVSLLLTINVVCPRCQNPAAQQLYKLVRKFTLFFIPLFPISTKYLMQCTFCGLERSVSKQEAEHLQAGAQPGPQPMRSAPQQPAQPFPPSSPQQPAQPFPPQPPTQGQPPDRRD